MIPHGKAKIWKPVFSAVKRLGLKLEKRGKDLKFYTVLVLATTSLTRQLKPVDSLLQTCYFYNYENSSDVFLSMAGWQDYLTRSA